ncbi:hypothetical protein [Spartinivicinus poritis]|uniref:Lipoprotein n=1 Tax=Spartinivicinus poritis TaxID=2994640 RepID=A0ABT5UAZ4_9GAMM|nr:hypothetical protein [Spartinivicinus sp. A2-2]MDE1463550.1 hypothetical protein [Spartinivicinus sp. A2-2]
MNKLFFLMIFIIAIVFSYGCEKVPSANTPEYFEAHGIKKGEENIIRIEDIAFKIPADIPMNVYTVGDIKSGQTDTLTVYLDLSYLLEHTWDGGILAPWMVRVEMEKFLYENPKNSDFRLQANKWSKVIDNTELGLTEFHSKNYRGGWGYISYQSSAKHVVTPLGGPVQFRCTGHPIGEIDTCWGGYQHPNGFYVSYFISSELLPFWHEVHQNIVSKVNSLIIE